MEKCNSADGVIQAARPVNGSNGTQNNGKVGSANGVINQNSGIMSRSAGDPIAHQKYTTQSLPRNVVNNSLQNLQRILGPSRTSSLSRNGSADGYVSGAKKQFNEEDEATTPTDSPPSPPPKPIRSMGGANLRHHESNMSIKDLPLDNVPLNRVATYHASGSDSGNGSGDSAQSSAATDPLLDMVQPPPVHRPGGVIIKNPRFMPSSASSATLKSFAEFDFQAIEDNLLAMNIPEIEQVSHFDLENFQTLLLPAIENKPLDNGALNTFRMMLSETGPRILANHMTRIDIKLILGDVEKMKSNGVAVNGDAGDVFDCTGIELITLSHGKKRRQDLIERTECIRLLVAVTILTCTSDDERAETLNKWIQVAVDTKTALGNLFGFSAIMLGLCMPQVRFIRSFGQ